MAGPQGSGDMSLSQAIGVLQQYLNSTQPGSAGSAADALAAGLAARRGGGAFDPQPPSLAFGQPAAQQAQQRQQGPGLRDVVRSLQAMIPELDPSHPNYPLRGTGAAPAPPQLQQGGGGGDSPRLAAGPSATWLQERLLALRQQQDAYQQGREGPAASGATAPPGKQGSPLGWEEHAAAAAVAAAPRPSGSPGMGGGIAAKPEGHCSGGLSSLSCGTAAAAEWGLQQQTLGTNGSGSSGPPAAAAAPKLPPPLAELFGRQPAKAEPASDAPAAEQLQSKGVDFRQWAAGLAAQQQPANGGGGTFANGAALKDLVGWLLQGAAADSDRTTGALSMLHALVAMQQKQKQ